MAPKDKHSFWILPPDYAPDMDRLLRRRWDMWSAVPVYEPYMTEASTLFRFLEDFCARKERQSLHISEQMIASCTYQFLSVRTLRNGWLPNRWLALSDINVIPVPELPRLQLAIQGLPPNNGWTRLYQLCAEAFRTDSLVVHRGIVRR